MDSSQKYRVGKTPEGVTFYDFGDHIFYCNGGDLHSKSYPESVMVGGGGDKVKDSGAECHKERGYCG